MIASCSKRLESYLSDKSQVVYVFPAIPSLIVFVATMVSSSIYVTSRTAYEACQATAPDDNDYLRAYVLGSIICGYTFLALYANILIEFVPKLKGLISSFILLFFWIFGAFVWNIVGTQLVKKSRCTDTAYYGVAILNLVVFFTSIFGSIVYTIFVCLTTNQKPDATATKTQVHAEPTKDPQINNPKPI